MDEEYAKKKELMDWIVAGMAGRHYPKPSVPSKANLAEYRAGREPAASWYRPNNHRPPYISPEEAGYRSRASENAGNYQHIFNPDVECMENYVPPEPPKQLEPQRTPDIFSVPGMPHIKCNKRTKKCYNIKGVEVPSNPSWFN